MAREARLFLRLYIPGISYEPRVSSALSSTGYNERSTSSWAQPQGMLAVWDFYLCGNIRLYVLAWKAQVGGFWVNPAWRLVFDHFVPGAGSITKSRWWLGIPWGREKKTVSDIFIIQLGDSGLVSRSSTSEHGLRGFDSQHDELVLVWKRLEGSWFHHSPWRGESSWDQCFEAGEIQWTRKHICGGCITLPSLQVTIKTNLLAELPTGLLCPVTV